MRLSAPKRVTWLIALVVLIVGLIGYLFTIPVLTAAAFWLVCVSALLLLLATALDGL